MKKTGTANLPLHGGKAPPWLFQRMIKLAGGISAVIIDEYSQQELLNRLADPYWFQAFGCVLGFDWHSSGLTTTVTGALKEGIDSQELGIAVCGGKGRASRKAQTEIKEQGEAFSLSSRSIDALKYSSRMSAKVDSAAVQDGYNLYHHAFFFDEKGKWSVVQQGMNPGNRYARRYHWTSVNLESFVSEPHNAVCCDKRTKEALNMTAKDSRGAQGISLDLINDSPDKLRKYFTKQSTLSDFSGFKSLNMPRTHFIINMNQRNLETLKKAHDFQPQNYEELLSIRNIGPKSVRALALVSEIIYGKTPSWHDPVKYSFSHGGKDGIPYPVDRDIYDKSIEMLQTGIQQAKLGNKDKLNALKRLNTFTGF